MNFRSKEKDKVWYRTDRIFSIGAKWYFTTREGNNVGPFASKNEADRGVSRYLDVLNLQESGGVYAAKVASQGLWATTNFA